MHPRGLYFIIADPDDYAWMISQPLDVIDGLVPGIIQKIRVPRIHTASEHEILPDEYAHLIAQIIEVIALIDAAAPHPDHVHIGVADRFDQPPIPVSANTRGKTIGRYPVAAFCKYGYSVDVKLEALAPAVGLPS